MKIQALHPTIGQPKTRITEDITAGAVAISVANNSGFSNSDYTVIGKAGQENARIHQVSSLSGAAQLNYASDALAFSYTSSTPVSYIKYNQVKFYLGDWSGRYSTGSITVAKDSVTVVGDGTSWGSITTEYALKLNGKWYDIKSVDSITQITLVEPYTDENLTGQSYALVPFTLEETLDIAIDQEYTVWDDSDALTEDYYRTEYYNETNTASSARSSVISAAAVEGSSPFSVQAIQDEVLSELRDPNAERRSRNEITRDINNAVRELLTVVISSIQEDYLGTFGTIDFIAGEDEYTLPDDFRKAVNVQISYDGQRYRKGQMMSVKDENPNVTYSEMSPYYYMRGNVIGVRPTPSTAVSSGVKMFYDRSIPYLEDEGDELPEILKDFKRAVVDYCLMNASMADNDLQVAGAYKIAFSEQKVMMTRGLKHRDTSENRRVRVTKDRDLYGGW